MFDLWTKREIKMLAALAVSVILLLSTLAYYVFSDRPSEVDDGIPLPSAEQSTLQEGETDSELVGQKDGGTSTAEPVEIVVDVKGAVKNPGIYHLPSDSRIFQAIEAAGGTTDEADTNQLNMADFLTDGMAVVVPAKGEEASELQQTSGGTGGDSMGTGKVNVNRATEEELQTLNGIGPSKAAAIVQDREENGPFKSVDDLDRVSGIGEKTLENIRDSITVR